MTDFLPLHLWIEDGVLGSWVTQGRLADLSGILCYVESKKNPNQQKNKTPKSWESSEDSQRSYFHALAPVDARSMLGQSIPN